MLDKYKVDKGNVDVMCGKLEREGELIFILLGI